MKQCFVITLFVVACAFIAASRAGFIDNGNRNNFRVAVTTVTDDTSIIIWRNGAGEGQLWQGLDTHDVADGQRFYGGPTSYSEPLGIAGPSGPNERYTLVYAGGVWRGMSPDGNAYSPGKSGVAPTGTYSAIDAYGYPMRGTFEYAKITNVVWR